MMRSSGATMTKFAALALAILALMVVLALAEATGGFQTVVVTTTTVIAADEQAAAAAGNQGGSESQKCRQQIDPQRQQLQHCQDYLSTHKVSYIILEQNNIAEINSMLQQRQEEPHLMECCVALKNIEDSQCRCQAVDEALKKEEEQSGQSKPDEREQLVETARNLPGRCKLDPQECQIREDFFRI